MLIKRRDFLKLLGGVSGAIAVSSCGLDQVIDVPEEVIEKVKNGHGIETWKNTICSLCPGGCGISTRLIDDVPVYIKGNNIYPVNQGGMCPQGHSALELLFNPDRVKNPLKRIGIAGSGKWESVSWNESLKLITDKMSNLRNAGNPHQVVFLAEGQQGLMTTHISRFMEAYGSPNFYQLSSVENDIVPYNLVHGCSQLPSYDFYNAKIILSFGSNFLEEGHSPVYYTKLYSTLREFTREGRTRLVQIDSRMNLTAANADQWIPIKPGAYGALALGIAHVIIREELYDKNFIRNYSFGFEDWTDKNGVEHLGFKSDILANYYPENVSKISGVPAETILEIGRELGNNPPAIVIGDNSATDNTNGSFTQMAVYSLNALLGNIEKEGGIFFVDAPPFSELPPLKLDATAKTGFSQLKITQTPDSSFPLSHFSIENVTNNILADEPYPVSLLFLYGGNSLFKSINHHNFAEAIKKIPLVVSFNSFIDETSEYADIILPDHTFLEKWDEISNVPSVGFTHVGIQQPVIEPIYDSRNTADLLIDIAKDIGGTVADSISFNNYQSEIKYRMKGIYESGIGSVASEGMRGAWLEYLNQRGWHAGSYDSFDEFWNLLLESGGWWNPIRKDKSLKKIFNTPSGKFEFYSQKLKSVIDNLVEKTGGSNSLQNLELVLNKLSISARGDTVFLPHHEPVPYDDELPLYLTTFQLLTNRDGQSANLPMMQEMFGYTTRNYWSSWVELNPQTAEKYGIDDGAWIWIESSVGTVKVQTKIHPGIMPSVVSIPFGLGHTSYGRYAEGHGVNPNSILNNLYDGVNGKPALQATKVKISLVT